MIMHRWQQQKQKQKQPVLIVRPRVCLRPRVCAWNVRAFYAVYIHYNIPIIKSIGLLFERPMKSER